MITVPEGLGLWMHFIWLRHHWQLWLGWAGLTACWQVQNRIVKTTCATCCKFNSLSPHHFPYMLGHRFCFCLFFLWCLIVSSMMSVRRYTFNFGRVLFDQELKNKIFHFGKIKPEGNNLLQWRSWSRKVFGILTGNKCKRSISYWNSCRLCVGLWAASLHSKEAWILFVCTNTLNKGGLVWLSTLRFMFWSVPGLWSGLSLCLGEYFSIIALWNNVIHRLHVIFKGQRC